MVGDVITDEDCVVHLLASLPDSYNVLVTALEASEEVPKMKIVTQRLLHEERKSTSKICKPGESEKAMAAKRHINRKKVGPQCYECKNFGHIKKDCHHSKGKINEKKMINPRHHKAHHTKLGANVYDSDSDCAGLIVHHVLSTLEVQLDQCIVDSGATCHMCNDKGLFDNFFDLTQAQDVTLGDGHHLKVVGR